MSVGHSRRYEPQALAAPVWLLGEQLLQMRLDPVLGECHVLIGRAHLVTDVREHLGDRDLEPVLARAGALSHDHHLGDSSITVGGVIQFSGL